MIQVNNWWREAHWLHLETIFKEEHQGQQSPEDGYQQKPIMDYCLVHWEKQNIAKLCITNNFYVFTCLSNKADSDRTQRIDKF